MVSVVKTDRGRQLEIDVAMATSPAKPGQSNEDFIGAVPSAVVLLDGAGIAGIEAICRHGVAWYTHRLGGALLGRLSRDGQDLGVILADPIDEISGEHRLTCDIANPSSPQATVAIFRFGEDRADFLILADSFLVLDQAGGQPQVVTDEREVAVRRACSAALEGIAAGAPEYVRARDTCIEALRGRRNQPGGYWVAKDDPRAAFQAVTGSRSVRDLSGAALLSNGASRIVDSYGLAAWPDVLDMLRGRGPSEIIRRVREAEADGSRGGRRPDATPPDDATVAYCTAAN
jgi:Protein phosphatase 2C